MKTRNGTRTIESYRHREGGKTILSFGNDPAAAPAGHVFFTSVINPDNTAQRRILSGPFPTYAAAQDDLDRVRAMAESRDCRAVWYCFGSCSLPAEKAAEIKPLFPLPIPELFASGGGVS